MSSGAWPAPRARQEGKTCPYCGKCPRCCGEGYVYPRDEQGGFDHDAPKVPCDHPWHDWDEDVEPGAPFREAE